MRWHSLRHAHTQTHTSTEDDFAGRRRIADIGGGIDRPFNQDRTRLVGTCASGKNDLPPAVTVSAGKVTDRVGLPSLIA